MIEKIALQKNLITNRQCIEAIKACKDATAYDQALKEYFLSRNMISKPDMDNILQIVKIIKILKKNSRFEVILSRMGLLDQATIQKEIAKQKKGAGGKKIPEFIGDVFLKSGQITPEQYQEAVRHLTNEPTAAGKEAAEPEPSPENGMAEQTARPQAIEPDATLEPPLEETPEINMDLWPELEFPEPELPEPELIDTTEEASTSRIQKRVAQGLFLDIQEDRMAAFLKKDDGFSNQIQVEDIMDILRDNSVTFGVVNKEVLQNFIASTGFKKNAFQVAKGKEPVLGEDARVEYYFDTDHLKAGEMDDEGNIDFRERGELPMVEKGMLLAEKFPVKKSEPGMTVSGEPIETPKTSDARFNAREGAALSEDGLKIYAQANGCPKLTQGGEIMVQETFRVDKDVDYNTGHVDYDGDIEVKGTLKSGFKIRGRDIRIDEVEGGIIEALGDVIVKKGVFQASIHAWGNVKANAVHSSEISCLGNIRVTKEIVDSGITSSGTCLIPKGEIIASKVAANRGIHALRIGTEKSNPNTIILGRDLFIEKAQSLSEQELAAIKDEMEVLKLRIAAATDTVQALNGKVTQMADELDRASEKKIRIALDLSREKEQGTDKPASSGRFNEARIQCSRLGAELMDSLDRMEIKRNHLNTLMNKITYLDQKRRDLEQELEMFKSWQEVNPGILEITVDSDVSTGNLIQGRHCELTIKNPLKRVVIKEGVVPDTASDQDIYEIQIHENNQ